MNKWTRLALVAFVAVLGGSYYLLSQSQGKTGGEPGTTKADDLNVEDFDAADAGDDDKGDNTYDMLDDPDAAPSTATSPTGHDLPGPRANQQASGSEVETIDDVEDQGETVDEPVAAPDVNQGAQPASPQAKP